MCARSHIWKEIKLHKINAGETNFISFHIYYTTLLQVCEQFYPA